jgi:hypothetical protein
LKKLILVALALLVAGSATTVALAQGASGASLTVSVSPSKAGSKKKPKAETIKLKITNNNSKQTLGKLVISYGKNLKLSTKGLTQCKQSVLDTEGPAGCPTNSSIGKGTAKALAGVNGPTPAPLNFDVTAFITGSNKLAFFLQQQGGAITFTVPGKIAKASGVYGQKLTLTIPSIPAQQYPAGVWNGLVELNNTFGKKKGKNALVTSVGCSKKKHPFKTALTFTPNPVDPGGTTTATADAKCS